jgi:hypothetical protein
MMEDNTVRLVKKRITVDIAYFVGEDEPERGIFRGGIQEAPYLNELVIAPTADEVYDERSDTLQPSGKTQVNVYGTKRGYTALAQCLLSLCALETADPDYHLHLDSIHGMDGEDTVHLILHGPRDKTEPACSGESPDMP